MRAAVLHEPGGALAVEDRPRPEPGAGDVLLRVRACGLGLTLVWNRNGRRDAPLPRIIGHEIAGDVVAVGPSVEGIWPGDRAAVYYYLSCGSCRRCRGGQDNLCEDRRGQVGREIDGGLAEYVRLPAANLCPIPPGVDYVGAAIAADAIATPLHVLASRARVEPGETVVVIGAGGGVGVHAVQVARHLGARVIAVDRTAEKVALAEAAGAEAALVFDAETLADAVRRLTDGRGADVVVELVGLAATMRAGAACLGTAGRLVLVGSYDRAAELRVRHETIRGERTILGSQYCTRAELATALALVDEGRVRPVVTRTCTVDEADAVLREIEAMTLSGRACVVFD